MSLKLGICGFLILIFASAGIAQDCIPDQSIKEIGFFPKIIDDAIAWKPYKQVLQIRVFKDTVVVIAGTPTLATIDSINVVDILGLPNGFYYTCSRKNCSYIPDSTGCATLIGNPTSSDIGSYPLLIPIMVYAKIFGLNTSQPDTIDQFTINVTGNSAVTNVVLNANRVCFPNPSATGKFKYNALFSSHIQGVACYSTFGQRLNVNQTSTGFELSGNKTGLYYAEIRFTNGLRVIEKIQIRR